MRIAWVLYGSLDQVTGGTIYDRLIVESLRRSGESIEVLSITPGTDLLPLLLSSPFDVIVGDELCFAELAPAFASLRSHSPRARLFLLVHHLTGWETSTRIEEEHRALTSCDEVITTSEATRTRLLREGTTAPITVVVPGSDRLSRLPVHVHVHVNVPDLVFLFLGTLTARKRALELVRAFSSCPDARARLVLAGSLTRDPSYVSTLTSFIASISSSPSLAARITLPGELDDLSVSRLLSTATALVMPSSLEGWGIAATEAIFFGVPVIAARAQGLEEALGPARDAAIFADDEPALASALTRFATDASLRAAMQAAARDASSRMPTWSDSATAFSAALCALSPRSAG